MARITSHFYSAKHEVVKCKHDSTIMLSNFIDTFQVKTEL